MFILLGIVKIVTRVDVIVFTVILCENGNNNI